MLISWSIFFLKFLKWLLSFDFKNDFFFNMIDSSDDDFEHSFNLKLSIVHLRNLINFLKKKHLNKSLKSFSFDIDNFKFKYLLWCLTLNFVLRRTTENLFDKYIIDLTFFNSWHFNVLINFSFFFKWKRQRLFFYTACSFNVFSNIKSSWIHANQLRIKL